MTPLSLLIAYLIGGLPLGLMVCKLWKGVDPRDVGSGNIGATNISRILGPTGGVIVFLIDVGKGFVAVSSATALAGASGGYWLPVGAAIGALMGNNFPVWLKFKGGKGASISLGIGLAVAWKIALAAFGIWLIAVLLTRYISVASMAAVAFTPLLTIDLEPKERWPSLLTFTAGVALMVIYKHRGNIKRLRAGTEPKINLMKKRETDR